MSDQDKCPHCGAEQEIPFNVYGYECATSCDGEVQSDLCKERTAHAATKRELAAMHQAHRPGDAGGWGGVKVKSQCHSCGSRISNRDSDRYECGSFIDGTFSTQLCSILNKRQSTRDRALRMFRIFGGTGDSGSELSFNSLNEFNQVGWLRLARLVGRITSNSNYE